MESIIKQKIDSIAECIFDKIQNTEDESVVIKYNFEMCIFFMSFDYKKLPKNYIIWK